MKGMEDDLNIWGEILTYGNAIEKHVDIFSSFCLRKTSEIVCLEIIHLMIEALSRSYACILKMP